MKKCTVILLAVMFTASAQAQLSFGAKAGLNLTNISQKWGGKKPSGDDKFSMKPGFQLGVVAEYEVTENFVIQPGLVFAQQGAQMKEKHGSDWMKYSINLNYLQIPINGQYKMELSGMNLVLQAGPYIGFAIGGNEKVSWKMDGKKDSDKESIEFGSKDGEMKRLDFGLGVGAALELGNIQVGVGYNLGLMNLMNGGDSDNFIKNNGIAITATYLLKQ